MSHAPHEAAHGRARVERHASEAACDLADAAQAELPDGRAILIALTSLDAEVPERPATAATAARETDVRRDASIGAVRRERATLATQHALFECLEVIVVAPAAAVTHGLAATVDEGERRVAAIARAFIVGHGATGHLQRDGAALLAAIARTRIRTVGVLTARAALDRHAGDGATLGRCARVARRTDLGWSVFAGADGRAGRPVGDAGLLPTHEVCGTVRVGLARRRVRADATPFGVVRRVRQATHVRRTVVVERASRRLQRRLTIAITRRREIGHTAVAQHVDAERVRGATLTAAAVARQKAGLPGHSGRSSGPAIGLAAAVGDPGVAGATTARVAGAAGGAGRAA